MLCDWVTKCIWAEIFQICKSWKNRNTNPKKLFLNFAALRFFSTKICKNIFSTPVIFRLKSVTQLIGPFWASWWYSQMAHSLGQRTSRRAPSNSAWGRRYDPWCATGLPIFGGQDIIRGRGGGRRVNCMAFRTGGGMRKSSVLLAFALFITKRIAD